MAAPNWNQAQVLAQLDSGMHWRSSTITYAFPTTSSGIYADGEESGFRPLNSTQQSIARLALAVWDEATAASIVPGSVGRSDIEFGYTSTGIGYAHAYFPTNGSVYFNATDDSLVNHDRRRVRLHDLHPRDRARAGPGSHGRLQRQRQLVAVVVPGQRGAVGHVVLRPTQRGGPTIPRGGMQADWAGGQRQHPTRRRRRCSTT
jgi:hypothetical protein